MQWTGFHRLFHGMLSLLAGMLWCDGEGDHQSSNNNKTKQNTFPILLKSMNYPTPGGVGSLACYQCIDQVGEGTYGYVYKALDKRSNETVALKR